MISDSDSIAAKIIVLDDFSIYDWIILFRKITKLV